MKVLPRTGLAVLLTPLVFFGLSRIDPLARSISRHRFRGGRKRIARRVARHELRRSDNHCLASVCADSTSEGTTDGAIIDSAPEAEPPLYTPCTKITKGKVVQLFFISIPIL
jgi:hypothetical protein